MMSVTACAGDTTKTIAAAAASCKNLKADFTIESFHSAGLRKCDVARPPALVEPPACGCNPASGWPQHTIDNGGGCQESPPPACHRRKMHLIFSILRRHHQMVMKLAVYTPP